MKFAVPKWPSLNSRKPAAMPIGMELAKDTLYLVQCERAEQGSRICAAASVPYNCSREELLADKKALKKFVSKALTSAPFKGKCVHTSLAANEVRMVPLSLSVPAGQNEQVAVIKALRDKLRSDLSNEVVDYLKIRSNASQGPELNVLAVVATHDAVTKHLHTIEDAGLEPVSLDVGPAALARLLGTMHPEDHEKSLLLINFGLEKTYITVVYGRRLMLDREVEFGQHAVLSKLADTLAVDRDIAETLLQDHESSIVSSQTGLMGAAAGKILDEILYPQFTILEEEVSRTLVYIASKTHGSSTQSIYLNGSLANYPYIQKKVQSLFDVPVKQLDPMQQLGTTGPNAVIAHLQPNAGFALATGLALRG